MKKAFYTTLLISLIGFIASAASLFLISFISTDAEPAESSVSVVIAIGFWLGLLVGIASSFAASRLRVKIEKRVAKGRTLGGLPGIISFNRDVISLVLYSVFAIGAVLIVVDLAFDCINEYVLYASVALTYLAFAMHCMADGKNYKFYKLLKKGEKHGNNK